MDKHWLEKARRDAKAEPTIEELEHWLHIATSFIIADAHKDPDRHDHYLQLEAVVFAYKEELKLRNEEKKKMNTVDKEVDEWLK